MDTLRQLFLQHTGEDAQTCKTLTPAGSNRRYYRLAAGKSSAIGVVGTSLRENEAFFAIATQLRSKGVNIPEVYAISNDRLCYLQQDLGDTSLFDLLMKAQLKGSYGLEEMELLRKVMRLLPDIQWKGANGFDFTCCYPSESLNRRNIQWDLHYFKYCFLKATGLEFEEELLEDDFDRMAEMLLCNDCSTFMYRDFQSRNVMIHDGEPWFIDFQGGRRGPMEYDLVSFLWQARANFTPAMRKELIEEYIQSAMRYTEIDKATFGKRLTLFVLFRTLQVLGAYGYRGYFEHKLHFMQSIPLAMDNLRALMAEEEFPELPYLCILLQQMVSLPKFAPYKEDTELTVRIYSFSYRKGIPDDDSGNGGGFVFDCRAIHNPGRYDEYKLLTGRDEPVRIFLDSEKAMQEFLRNTYSMVDYAVEKYLSRGFKNLMVSFGCTGGQHRSVYSAEHLAHHLAEKYGVRVILTHREQGITEELPSKRIQSTC
ncbi:MAG: phosphotransferase [Bacteroidaceae bacterium]|nr:phosphotransferase [Bacteroidaceae bacterium]